ncbi:MAG: hypothetical protein GY803_27040 [Chloroflexi bacterium]|nr:hypothetical protein [Chloroflexota bacterium]
MTVKEPELISIIEGPTPEFHPTLQRWLQSIHESPMDQGIAQCQLRTATGSDILERCQNAWRENRPVKLEFPDEMRMSQLVDVVAMRLTEVEEGQMLHLWVALPFEMIFVVDDDDDEFDDELNEGDGLDYI